MTEQHWIWGTLSPEGQTLAHAVATRWLANVHELGLGQGRYAHTPDERRQKLVGAQGEVAFYALTGRPFPTVRHAASTWHAPDVDGYAIKTVTGRHYRLLFDDADLEGAHSLVLMLNECPTFALIGQITVAHAIAIRHWADNLPRPCWAIHQRDLSPWT